MTLNYVLMCSHYTFHVLWYICSQLDFISGIHGNVICYLWGVCVAVMCRLAWGQMCECTSACISRRRWSSLTPLELSYLQCRLCLFSVCVFQVSCVYGTIWHYASVRASSGSGNVMCLQSVQSAARPAGCHHGEMIALQVAEMQRDCRMNECCKPGNKELHKYSKQLCTNPLLDRLVWSSCCHWPTVHQGATLSLHPLTHTVRGAYFHPSSQISGSKTGKVDHLAISL